MNFITKEFYGKEYTLVEKLTEFGQDIIYHFIGDEDELFCLLKNKRYIIIKDEEKIKQIQEEIYGQIEGIYFKENIVLKLIESLKKIKREVTAKEHREFEAEQMELLRTLPEFDEKNASERLKKILIFCRNERVMGNYIAFYSIREDAIYFKDSDLTSDDIYDRRTRLHETIHALIDPKKNVLLDKIAGRGLVEGATERTVEKVFSETQRKFDLYYGQAICNLSKECEYKSAVCIIKQIEYIMGQTITDFALNANSQIFLDFSDSYGKDMFRYIRCKTNRLINPHLTGKKELKILKKLQESILTHVFDTEFQNVDSIQSAEQYLRRLGKFQETQVYIIGDDSFQKYYCNKLQQIKQLLQEKGVSSNKISSFLQQYKYTDWIKMNDLDLPEKIKNRIMEIDNQKLQIANIAKRIRLSQIRRKFAELKKLIQKQLKNINQFVK